MLPPLDNVVFFDIETEGTDPFQHKVITVQVRYRGKTTIWKEWEMGEAKCILSFFDGFLDSIERKVTSFVGYNVLRFDVAFLDERLRRLRIMNDWKWRALHDYLHWIDLYQLLGDAYYKAKDWYSSMAGLKQEVRNADIPVLYAQRDYATIVRYIEDEMRSMEIVYQGIAKEPFYSELVKLRQKVVGENKAF